MQQARILVIGYLSVDSVQQSNGPIRQSPGGAALYAALGARRAGAEVDLAASIGTDYPDAWLAAMEAEGIGLQLLERRPIPSRWAKIRHREDGSRESTHYADPAWWRSSDAHTPSWPALNEYGAIVVCPIPVSPLSRLLDDAERMRIPVIADINEAFAASDPGAILSLVHRIDVFAPSREETRLLYPGLDDTSAARSLARRGTAVVQKRGAEGLFVVDTGGEEEWRLPALDTQVIDPTGAGDATVGAIAARRLLGDTIIAAARSALQIGALAVSGVGPDALGPSFQAAMSANAASGAQSR